MSQREVQEVLAGVSETEVRGEYGGVRASREHGISRAGRGGGPRVRQAVWERLLTAVTTLRQERRAVLEYLTAACAAASRGEPAPSRLLLYSAASVRQVALYPTLRLRLRTREDYCRSLGAVSGRGVHAIDALFLSELEEVFPSTVRA